MSYTDTSLQAGKVEKYKVKGYYKSDDGEAVYSASSSAFCGALAPAKASGLAVASKTETAVKLKWTVVKGANAYEIYRYDAVSGSYKRIGVCEGAAYTDSTVSKGTAYKYKLRAAIKTDSKTYFSGYSSVVSVTTAGEAAVRKGTVKIADGYLNLRSSASTDGDAIAKLYNGDAVTVIGTSGEWYKVTVEISGKSYTGYAHSDYIVLGAAIVPENEKCPYTEPAATVRNGDSGESVKWVQWYLYKLGYLEKDDIDGAFGPTTQAAVIAFQKDESLDADGLVGSMTRKALMEAYD